MCLRMRAGSWSTRSGDLLEAGGDAGDGAAGGDGVLAAHAAQEVQRAAGVLGEVADVLVVAFVDDAVQPALGGPGLDQGEAGLGVVELVEVAFQSDDELGLGEGAVGQVALHQRRVEAEVGGGEQPDRAGALQVAVELEQLSRGQPRVVVHWCSSIGLRCWSGRSNIGHGGDMSGGGRAVSAATFITARVCRRQRNARAPKALR